MQALRKVALSLALSVAVAFGFAVQSGAETIKIGLLKVSGSGPVMIAQEKGYFSKEGLTADLFFPDQPALIAQGLMAGDLAFGIGAPTSAFYNLAGQGALRIIAANAEEAPGFRADVVVVSNQAYASSLKTLRDLAGRSSAIIAVGTPQQYILGAIAQKYSLAYGSIRMMPLGSFPNMVAAVVGGSSDSAIAPLSAARQAITDEKLHNIAWIGDEMRMTLQIVMTVAKVADDKAELVNRFLRVYRSGARDYHDAFSGPDERPLNGPGAAEDYAALAKYMSAPLDLVKLGIAYIDADARLDATDIQRQIAWYKSQGMVKPEVDPAKIIDARYAVPLPLP